MILDKIYNKTMKEYLNTIRREGELLGRYDKQVNIENTILYDETESILIYKFKDIDNEEYIVTMIMSHGEYVDYFKKKV